MVGTVGGLLFTAHSVISKGNEKNSVLLKEGTFLISIQVLDCEKMLKLHVITTKHMRITDIYRKK